MFNLSRSIWSSPIRSTRSHSVLFCLIWSSLLLLGSLRPFVPIGPFGLILLCLVLLSPTSLNSFCLVLFSPFQSIRSYSVLFSHVQSSSLLLCTFLIHSFPFSLIWSIRSYSILFGSYLVLFSPFVHARSYSVLFGSLCSYQDLFSSFSLIRLYLVHSFSPLRSYLVLFGPFVHVRSYFVLFGPLQSYSVQFYFV